MRTQPIDISSRIETDSGDCRFGPELERAFESMRHVEGTVAAPRTVRIGTLRLVPSVVVSQDSGRPHRQVAVHLDAPVLWNGLIVRSLRTEAVWEWAESSITFRASPARVRAVLRRLGIRMPVSGALDLPGGECPNAITVEADGNGATLACGGGC